jgi:hypothetical protein
MNEGLGEKPDADPERVFVVWDSTIDGMRNILTVLRDDPPAGFAVDALGLDSGSGTIWAGNVEPGIANAANVLAIVNKPNANVGYEIGFALGRNKGVRLVAWTKQTKPPKWVDRPPFKTQLIPARRSRNQDLTSTVTTRVHVVLSSCSANPPRSRESEVRSRKLRKKSRRLTQSLGGEGASAGWSRRALR